MKDKLLVLGLSLGVILFNCISYAQTSNTSENPIENDDVAQDILQNGGIDKDTVEHTEQRKEMLEDKQLREGADVTNDAVEQDLLETDGLDKDTIEHTEQRKELLEEKQLREGSDIN